jgi:formamidopyrimidine-DNA glycosylase
MPELPEVEIASRQLRSWLLGKRITKARAFESRVIRGQPRSRFAQLKGHKLQRIERVGKWMLLVFDGGEGLISHLGMTGKWIRRKKADAEPSHVRATFELSGYAVDYRDPRLFGRLIRGKSDALRRQMLAALGPDPLPGIDIERLHEKLLKTRRSLKETLMDQRTLAGLGNIYAGESLYRARLDPRRPGNTMTRAETQRLAAAIGESLRAALDNEDSDEPITYVEEGGRNFFLVYDRAGSPCQECGTAIERIVQGGRSTYFCPHCQADRSRGRRPTTTPPPHAAR